MEILELYAIAAGGALVLLLGLRAFPWLVIRSSRFIALISGALRHTRIIRRNRISAPWSYSDLILAFSYISINTFCVIYHTSSLAAAGSRAGTIALINIAPLYFSLHLATLADVFHVSLSTCRRSHAVIGYMSLALTITHLYLALRTGHAKQYPEPGRFLLLLVCLQLGGG